MARKRKWREHEKRSNPGFAVGVAAALKTIGEVMQAFDESQVLVVGGAGFVGSNLVRELVATSSAQVLVVDNLLSAERFNIPESSRVEFIEGSITHDPVLRAGCRRVGLCVSFGDLPRQEIQNSMADPLADHENNTYTTLKLRTIT